MVEEMYQQEAKEEGEEREISPNHTQNTIISAQTPTPLPYNTTNTTDNNNNNTISTTTTTATSAATATAATATTAITPTSKRSEINGSENDPSLIAINRQCFSENKAKLLVSNISSFPSSAAIVPISATTLPLSHSFQNIREPDCRRGRGGAGGVALVGGADYGGTTGTSGNSAAEIGGGSTLIRFGSSAGDVSLTLGLRHAGNLPETSTFSVRDFGGC